MKELKCYNGRCGIHSKSDNCLFAYTREGCPYRAATPPVADTGELEAAIALVRAEQNKHCGYPGYSDFLVRLDELGSLADTAPQPVADPKQIKRMCDVKHCKEEAVMMGGNGCFCMRHS